MTHVTFGKLKLDGGTQPREELDPVVVGDYADAMKRGEKFPPVEVVFDGSWYWLTDGFHRVKAAKLNGTTSAIEANVTQGTQQDAQWLSLAANQKHGLRRSTKDKQRAIIAALKHPAGVDKSDRAIAEHLGVDHKTVSVMRERLTGEIPQSPIRTGADGRAINTANIGAKPAVPKVTDKAAPAWFARLDPQLFYPYRGFGKMLVEEGFESIEKAKRDPRYALSYNFMSGYSLQNMPEMWEYNRVEPAGEPSREHLALLKKAGIKVDPYIPKAAPVEKYEEDEDFEDDEFEGDANRPDADAVAPEFDELYEAVIAASERLTAAGKCPAAFNVLWDDTWYPVDDRTIWNDKCRSTTRPANYPMNTAMMRGRALKENTKYWKYEIRPPIKNNEELKAYNRWAGEVWARELAAKSAPTEDTARGGWPSDAVGSWTRSGGVVSAAELNAPIDESVNEYSGRPDGELRKIDQSDIYGLMAATLTLAFGDRKSEMGVADFAELAVRACRQWEMNAKRVNA